MGKSKLAALLAVGSLLVSGCINTHIGFVVNEDGSGSTTATIEVSPAVLSLAGMSGEIPSGSIEEMCDELLAEVDSGDGLFSSDTGEDIEMTVVNDGSTCSISGTQHWGPGDLSTDEPSVDLVRLEDGGWRFSVDLRSADFIDELDLGDMSQDDITAMQAMGGLVEMPTLMLSIELPGTVSDTPVTNATRATKSGDSVIFYWDIDIVAMLSGELGVLNDGMYAQTQGADSGIFSNKLLVGIVAAVVLAAAIAFATTRRSKDGSIQ